MSEDEPQECCVTQSQTDDNIEPALDKLEENMDSDNLASSTKYILF
jgi:hypothetical protein